MALLLRSGDTFAGCRILSLCGSGGMGVVYLAEDFLHRKVALKIVAIGDAERELRGIQQYISIAENIPGMIRIYHAGIEDGQLFYIMEAADPLDPQAPVYAPKTLAAILKQQGTLPPHCALEIIRKLAEGLQQLHEVRLIHRDIKPENILFIHGEPKFCDPGLVCQQDTTVSFAGTLGYLPKECFNGEKVNSPDRDLYALGMVFYVAVTGEVPARYPRMPLSLHIGAKKKLWPLIVRVCNANARRRFRSAAEFSAALPQEIPEPNRFDRLCESFREFRLLHPRFMFNFSVILLVLLLCSAGIAAFCIHRSRVRAVFLAQCSKLSQSVEQRVKKNMPMLEIQLEVLAGQAGLQNFRKELHSLPEDPEKRLRHLRKMDEKLKTFAFRRLPQIPSKTDRAEAERISSAVRGFFASPLGNWIPSEKRKAQLKQLERLEKEHISGASTLKPGASFSPTPDHSQKFVYIPAGVFRDEKGKTVHIDHGFWCGDSEISSYTFCKERGRSWEAAGKFFPQTHFSWNDLLDFCRNLTISDRKEGFLPPNYIYRPLTSQEWRWVYQNAWHGIPSKTAPRKHTGQFATIYDGTPNELGIYHLPDNVRELVISSGGDKKHNHVSLCGGSYQQSGSDKPQIGSILKYQCLAPDVGSRLAIASGTLDFFDRAHWYMELVPFSSKGKIYHCISSYQAIFPLPKSRELCDLLGGRLCVPDDPELRKELRRIFAESDSFPIAVDAVVKDGRLETSAGIPYRYVRCPKKPVNPALLLCFHRGSILYRPCFKSCGFICEWNRDEYRKRTDPERILRNRSVVHSFRDGKKVYALVLCTSLIFPVRQIALLLGAKLAEPRTPELRERIRKELEPWKKHSIFLGGCWKFDRWVFMDGSVFKVELERKGYWPVSGLNAAGPGMLEGKLCALQRADGFLLEFDLP